MVKSNNHLETKRMKSFNYNLSTLLAVGERMLKNTMELNDRYEDYGIKININKTKTMAIGRKSKKIDIRIKDESVEQVDSFMN